MSEEKKDYIEREAVRDVIAEVFAFAEDAEEAIFELNSRVKALPTADVRRGRWVPVGIDAGVKCSNCSARFLGDMTDWAFCPHCGADMREGHPVKERDVRRVVFCRECKHCYQADEQALWCKLRSPAFLTAPDDICSRGTEAREAL